MNKKDIKSFLNEQKNSKDIDYLKAIFGDKDKDEIEKEINKLKNKQKIKEPNLYIFLGRLYCGISGVEKDYKEAVKWFSKAIDLDSKSFNSGIAFSFYQLGLIYLEGGFGIKQDYQKAKDFFQKASNNGNINAFYQLGCLYRDGNGVEQDYQKAIDFFQKAVEQHHPESQYELGLLYYCGLGKEINREKAITLFHESAEHGNIQAKIILELCKK